ncbi:MAG: amino acid adenylation domain-containing protein [Acidobacteriota bacterium]|nr:amino acid adenylation domain-containing protein [Acidobacteriota bacterium]
MTIRREDLKDLYPLTPMQEGMLFHARHEPGGPAYTEQVVWRISGAFDVAKYQQAWDALHARYDALRSVFAFEKSREPLQMVLKERKADFAFESLLAIPAAERETRAVAARSAEKSQGFDLARGPVLRVRVLQLAEAEHDVVLTWHHILLDGWSTHLVLRDLLALYDAALTNTPPALPPVPSFAPYVEWLKSRDREASLSYWQQLLDGYDAAAEISPLAAPGEGAFDLQRVDVRLDVSVQRDLQALASAHDATLSSVVQAAWGVVLGRYGDTRDVVFGAVVSGRSPEVPDIERMAGLLINTIPVRVSYGEQDSFATLVARVQRQAVDSQAHHASKLADIQGRTELRGGLIKHLLVFENYPASQIGAGTTGLSARVVETSEPTNYDLIVVVEPGDTLRLEFQFNARAYTHAQVVALGDHLGRFLSEAARQPGAAVTGLNMLSPAERDELVNGLNATARDYPSASTLAAQFTESVKRNGARAAVTADGLTLTYDELDQRANRLAHHLSANGVTAGDRVAVLLERSPALIEAMLAIVKLGASAVPLDPAAPAERTTFVAADARVRAIVALAATEVRAPGVTRIATDAQASEIAACPATAPPVTGAQANDEVVLFYTSGSTGTPKAVRVPHRAILRLVMNTDYVSLGVNDRVANISNVAFDAATFELWGPLLNGGEVHVLGRDMALTPQVLARELRSRGITAMFLTTALFNQVAREAPEAFTTLDTVMVGGEKVEPRWVKRILARGAPKRLLNAYGPTETCTFATWHLITSVSDAATDIPIGRPIANTTAYVVDRGLLLQPIGASGELLIGGPGVALGYHERPDLTEASFVANPFDPNGGTLYRTGDIVRRNADGDIEFIGRRDSQVKLRGFRIEPGEIESALRRFPGLDGALVMVHQDETTGDRRLIAYLAFQQPPARTIELEVRNHLRPLLPGYMIPSVFMVLEKLPLNANGKIDRKALPAPTRSGMGFGKTFVEPVSEVERKLAAIWETTLGATGVGRHDNFFELGGHSLTASTAISRIRAELKVDVPIASFFECTTLEALGALVTGLQAGAAPTPTGITRVQREAHKR